MPKYNPQEYFDRIKENHRQYLEKNMITHLEIAGGLEQAQLVQKFVRDIGYYRDEKAIYLDSAIEQIPTMDKIKQGALSALMGIGIGGLTQYASAAVPNPVAAAVAPVLPGGIITGAFSALLGAGAGYLMYKIWESDRAKPAAADFNEFQIAMKQAGFTPEKYNELSADVVKLFHFRECLLLGATDNSGNNMREEFKKKYCQQNVDEKSLNIAIEAYFLEQLNELFNKAFARIYAVHDLEIKEDRQRTIIKWIKDYFQQPKNREVFTQQLQIEFMKQCIGFLEKEMNEPSFMAKHPYVPMLVTGLVAGAVALGIGAAIVGGPLTLAIGMIAIVIACVAAVGAYFAVKHSDALRFKRGPENRASLKNVIEDVTKETLRLNTLIKRAVETAPEDVELLRKYNDVHIKGFFKNLIGAEMEVARGSASSWIREYASRYRHNMVIENDLQQQETKIVIDAETQTEKMQKELQLSVKNGALTHDLRKFIEDTSRYLKAPENKEFIKKFAIVEKIRHQFLEITAAVDMSAKLPIEFCEFYTSPLQKGGLGGLEQDLNHVREFTSVNEQDGPEAHPYQKMLVAARRFDTAIVQDSNYPLIFTGDDFYRDLLGINISSQNEHIEDILTPANIQSYLNNSFDFLYTLNEQVKLNKNESSLATPFVNRPEFLVYRMVLLKQLASLADLNNARVEDSIRSEIKRFIHEKFHLDPDLLFDNLINQSLFFNPVAEDENNADNYLIDPLGDKHSLKQLDFLAECLRMDMAYSSMPITPKTLIQAEAEQFIIHKALGSKTIFCHEKSQKELRPSPSAKANTILLNAISNTQSFIQGMAEKPVMKKSGALASYITDTVSAVIRLQNQYQELLRAVENNPKIKIYPEEAIKALEQFKEELLNILATAPREENLLSSSNRFGAFEKSSIDLSKYEQEWVVVDFEPYKNPEETFVDELTKFIAQHERRAQGFFGSNTSRDLSLAAKKFLTALIERNANHEVDLSFITDNPQQFDNTELGLLIQKNIRLCNAVSIEQFFSQEENSAPNVIGMGNNE